MAGVGKLFGEYHHQHVRTARALDDIGNGTGGWTIFLHSLQVKVSHRLKEILSVMTSEVTVKILTALWRFGPFAASEIVGDEDDCAFAAGVKEEDRMWSPALITWE